jgi:hypothetical protein
LALWLVLWLHFKKQDGKKETIGASSQIALFKEKSLFVPGTTLCAYVIFLSL